MKANFIEDDHNRLALQFEPEDTNERLLLKAFDLQATANQDRMIVSGCGLGGPNPGLRSIRIRHDNTPVTTVEIMNVPDTSYDEINRLKAALENQRVVLERASNERNQAQDRATDQQLEIVRLKEQVKNLTSSYEHARVRMIDLATEVAKANAINRSEDHPKGMRAWPGTHKSLRGVRVGDVFKFKKPPPGWTSGNLLVVDKMPGNAAPDGWDYFPIEILDSEIEIKTGTAWQFDGDQWNQVHPTDDGDYDRDASYGQAVARASETRCSYHFVDGSWHRWHHLSTWAEGNQCAYRDGHLYGHDLAKNAGRREY